MDLYSLVSTIYLSYCTCRFISILAAIYSTTMIVCECVCVCVCEYVCASVCVCEASVRVCVIGCMCECMSVCSSISTSLTGVINDVGGHLLRCDVAGNSDLLGTRRYKQWKLLPH